MKYYLFMVTMCLVLSVTSQTTQHYVAEQIIESWTATVEHESLSDSIYAIKGVLPSYYDETLVQMNVNRIVGRYSDVSTYRTWRRKNNGDIEIVLLVVKTPMLISYSQSLKSFFIGWHQ